MKKQLLFVAAFAVASSILMTSCATVFSGSRQRVVIDSNVPQSEVRIDGEMAGVTPLATKLKRGFTGQTVQVTKEGYTTETITPKTNFNAVAVLNLTSLLGWGIDAATGAMMKYDKKQYNFLLKPVKKEATPVSTSTTTKE